MAKSRDLTAILARAGGGGRKTHLGTRSDCAPRNEGDARGTRKTQPRELIENKREKVAERVGFDAYPSKKFP